MYSLFALICQLSRQVSNLNSSDYFFTGVLLLSSDFVLKIFNNINRIEAGRESNIWDTVNHGCKDGLF